MKTRHATSFGFLLALCCLCAGQAATSGPINRLPVVEVTAFKDGHAFVVQEGPTKADDSGEVFLDEVPSPVLGTFWVYSSDKDSKVTSVVSGQRIVPIDRTALSLRELIEANPKAQVVVTQTNQEVYDAVIVGLLTRSSAELAETSPPNTSEQLPQKSNLVLLKSERGTETLSLEQIQSLTFKDKPNTTGPQEEFRNFLRVKVAGAAGHAPSGGSRVGMVYVQKGIRWIPSYRVQLDGKGKAAVQMEAIVVNEMMDLTNVTLNLVIGVPSFAFKDTIDPMAIQQAGAQLSQYFQNSGADNNRVQIRSFSNAIMSQQAGYVPPGAATGTAGPPADLPEGAKNEDLYVFTLRNISLRKGERMLLPISEQTVSYQDVFTLDISFAPPAELSRNMGSQQQLELARMINSPKAMHKARLTNNGNQPFTTAPALVFRDGKLVAQSMMTYAAPGASADLTLTTAVDIQVQKTDAETNRTPNALVVQGDHFFRIDLKGEIHLVNRRGAAIELEVNRYVLGQADQADHDGKIQMVNSFEDRQYLPNTGMEDASVWWNWYNWPWWWTRVNGAGRITWNLKLDPGQSVDLSYTWHYFWL